jgi:hypothetical protein
MCGCLSALSISTTSLPISIAVLPLLQEAKFFGTPQSRLETNQIGAGAQQKQTRRVPSKE